MFTALHSADKFSNKRFSFAGMENFQNKIDLISQNMINGTDGGVISMLFNKYKNDFLQVTLLNNPTPKWRLLDEIIR